MHLLVTGGAGFIGSNFVRLALTCADEYQVTVLDKLTYAGNPDNLKDLAGLPGYRFVQGDIADADAVAPLVAECDAIINFAAETHVDRSLLEPGAFVLTDVYGVYVLLEAAREHGVHRFIQISTDEVYGSVPEGFCTEEAPLNPSSPYSASKTGGEMMARGYFASHQVPVIISRGSNTFGPYHYPEKMIPLFVTNAIDDQPLPLYGDGKQVRDWLYVEDHARAILHLLHHGEPGEIYNVGGGNERFNIDVAQRLLQCLGKPETLIQHVTDRPGHDRRYALDCTKIHATGWRPQTDFDEALATTVQWYVDNEWWWRPIKSGEFAEYYRRQYGQRRVLPESELTGQP